MGWINKIADAINMAFSNVRPPLGDIPPLLLLCEVYQRPGLSAIVSSSSIIKRMPEAGIETGVNDCGLPNTNNKFIRIFCEELIKELKDNARITCVIEPGSLNSVGSGMSAGGPVVVTSVNTSPTLIMGIVE